MSAKDISSCFIILYQRTTCIDAISIENTIFQILDICILHDSKLE